MHERTMRAVARSLFVACCAVPTCITMMVIMVLWSPWYHAKCVRATEASLALQTGLDIRIGDLERINPTTWQLEDVQLRDNETKRSIGRVRIVSWVQEDDRTIVRLSQPEIRAEFLNDVWDLVHDRFLCRPEHTLNPIRVAADDLTVISERSQVTIRDFDGRILPGENEIAAILHCLPAGERPDVEPMEIEIRRHRGDANPSTSVSLRTGELKAPLAWLSGYDPRILKLGDEATFHGAAKLSQVAGPTGLVWMLDLSSARIEQVDLSRLTEFLPHRMTGRGELQLNRCQIVRGGVVDIDGTLQITRGWVSASLLPRLAEDLGCQLTTAIAEDFQFDLLAIDFDLYDGKLSIEGLCNSQRGYEKMPPGTMLCAAGQPIVLTGPQHVAATQVMRLFASPHSVSVPVSGQTMEMLWLLQPPRGPLTIQDSIGHLPNGQLRSGALPSEAASATTGDVDGVAPRVSARIRGFQSVPPRDAAAPASNEPANSARANSAPVNGAPATPGYW
ncbi:hypothetical protein LOC71_18515 [Rhodopirellula sp. JC740]|uniref:AsmA-like C-terminal domain-containing protein n=1 Tax=Rhodopirellula halodulae TaxID=2894198 RepID=A0ABS8NL51_9BACT|nr:hypothetical protein [Rhodopirellula sp. JC740]MCC9644275.1 hypothetical protein [Rhodopirellula sp. JC740]